MQARDKKAALRSRIRKLLKDMPENERKAQSRSACERLAGLPEFLDSSLILAYMAMPTECDPSYAVQLAWDFKKRVAFPLCAGEGELKFYIPDDEDAFVRGMYGILEPDTGRSKLIRAEDIDFMIVPGVAYGLDCRRLGQGGGYYDRVLSDTRAYAAGLCFNIQVCGEVPWEPHDAKVDCVVSATGCVFKG